MELLVLFQLLITEVHPTPAAGEPEWVELHSQSGPTDLSGMRICDSRTCALLPNLLIPADAYAIVTRDASALRESRTLPSGTIVIECPLPSLGNSSDRVELHRVDSSIADSVSYVVAAGGKGRSIERGGADDNGTITYNNEWLPSTAPDSATCGRSNARVQFKYDIAISGVFCSDSVLHIGILNSGMIEASSCSVTVQIGATILQRTIPALPPQGWTSIDVSRLDVPSASVVRNLPIDARINVADSRIENNRYSRHIILPPIHGTLMISEVLAEPSNEQCDFVEIWNGTTDTVDLAGWKIEDNGEQVHVILYPATLAPNGYIALASDTAVIRLTGGHHYAVVKPSLNVNATRDSIILRTPDGLIVDEAVYDRKYHADHLAFSRGHSLERRMPSMIGETSAMWATCPSLSGATPGATNAVNTAYTSDSATLQTLHLPCASDPTSLRYPCTIVWHQPYEQAFARLFVMGLDGVVVAQVLNGELIGRKGSVAWNGRSDLTDAPVPIGIYVAALECIDVLTARVTASVCPVTIGASP